MRDQNARIAQLEAENARLRNLTHTPIGTTWRETAIARFEIMQELRQKLEDALSAVPARNQKKADGR